MFPVPLAGPAFSFSFFFLVGGTRQRQFRPTKTPTWLTFFFFFRSVALTFGFSLPRGGVRVASSCWCSKIGLPSGKALKITKVHFDPENRTPFLDVKFFLVNGGDFCPSGLAATTSSFLFSGKTPPVLRQVCFLSPLPFFRSLFWGNACQALLIVHFLLPVFLPLITNKFAFLPRGSSM